LKTENGAIVFEIVKSAVGFVTLTASHDPDVTPFLVTRCHAQCVTAIAGQAKNKNLTFLAAPMCSSCPISPDGMHAYSYFPFFQKHETQI